MVDSFIKAHEDEITALRWKAIAVEDTKAHSTADVARKIDAFNKIMRRIAKLEARIAAAERYKAYKAELLTDVVFAKGLPA